MAANKLNRNILYNINDNIVLNPKVGKTPQKEPIAAPKAISWALPLA
jgi:hypothetical protein